MLRSPGKLPVKPFPDRCSVCRFFSPKRHSGTVPVTEFLTRYDDEILGSSALVQLGEELSPSRTRLFMNFARHTVVGNAPVKQLLTATKVLSLLNVKIAFGSDPVN